MPRARICLAVFALVVLSVGTLAFRSASAQEATPAARIGHPLVGAWILDRDSTHPSNPLQLIVATADGLYLGVAYGGSTAVGVWEATGHRTATVTLHLPTPIEGVPFV